MTVLTEVETQSINGGFLALPESWYIWGDSFWWGYVKIIM